MRPDTAVLAPALTAIILLPLMEALLRKFWHTGITNVAVMVQHLTLVAGMVGAAVAARQNRLLSLSNLSERLPFAAQRPAKFFSASWAIAITALLALASTQFVLAEKPAGQILAYGVPFWVVEAIMPVCFLLIAAQQIRFTGEARGSRVAAVALAAVWVAVWQFSPVLSFIGLGLATLAGVPAFVSLAGVALVLFRQAGEPIAAIPIAHYSLVTNAILPTIPMFTLAGYLVAESKAPQRLISLFRTLLGGVTGGAAIMTAVACAFFTSFTGGSGVTILALGGLLMPVLLSKQYSERNALGLVTGAGSLGLLFPPCLPLILFAIVARVPVESMFLGGILPGIVMLAATIAWGMFAQKRDRKPALVVDNSPRATRGDAMRALWAAKWELVMPLVPLGALFSGFATPVEAAALTALYAFVVEVFIHRDLTASGDLPRVLEECGLMIGGILLIQGVALGFTNYLVDAEVMTRTAEWVTSTIHSRWVFLLLLNLFLLVIGCLMEIYAAIVIQAPLLVALGKAFDVDPVHLGIIFLANLELGYLTPPVGLNLLLSSYRFNKPVSEVLRAVTPLTIVMAVGVLLITYVPALTTALPAWFRH